MKRIQSIKALGTLALAGTGSLAVAHEGHGLMGDHWHASDAWGFVVLAALVGVAWWSSRGGK
jgi:hypothetical protein